MSVTSVDSSALVKRYVPETGSTWIQALSAPQESNLLFITRITWVEVLSANREKRTGRYFDERRQSFDYSKVSL